MLFCIAEKETASIGIPNGINTSFFAVPCAFPHQVLSINVTFTLLQFTALPYFNLNFMLRWLSRISHPVLKELPYQHSSSRDSIAAAKNFVDTVESVVCEAPRGGGDVIAQLTNTQWKELRVVLTHSLRECDIQVPSALLE
jgi:hypothetical protein